MEEVICDNLLVDIIFRSTFLQNSKSFGEMFVQGNCFVAEFANEQILLLDFFFERECAIEVLLRSFEGGLGLF